MTEIGNEQAQIQPQCHLVFTWTPYLAVGGRVIYRLGPLYELHMAPYHCQGGSIFRSPLVRATISIRALTSRNTAQCLASHLAPLASTLSPTDPGAKDRRASKYIAHDQNDMATLKPAGCRQTPIVTLGTVRLLTDH